MGLFSRKKKDTGSADVKNHFEYEGKKYNALRAAIVPMDGGGNEKLTAADICASPEAQKYLVENKCSCVEEVTD